MKPFKVGASYSADLQRAYAYHQRGGKIAAERFWQRYLRTRKIIQANPFVARPRPAGWRQLTIPGSDFAIFYREMPEFWFLAAVISMVQDPDVIQAQLLIREFGEPRP